MQCIFPSIEECVVQDDVQTPTIHHTDKVCVVQTSQPLKNPQQDKDLLTARKSFAVQEHPVHHELTTIHNSSILFQEKNCDGVQLVDANDSPASKAGTATFARDPEGSKGTEDILDYDSSCEGGSPRLGKKILKTQQSDTNAYDSDCSSLSDDFVQRKTSSELKSTKAERPQDENYKDDHKHILVRVSNYFCSPGPK